MCCVGELIAMTFTVVTLVYYYCMDFGQAIHATRYVYYPRDSLAGNI